MLKLNSFRYRIQNKSHRSRTEIGAAGCQPALTCVKGWASGPALDSAREQVLAVARRRFCAGGVSRKPTNSHRRPVRRVGQRTSNYSWSGGFVVVRGKFGSEVLTEISGVVPRGENTVAVGSADKLRVGQEVEVYQSDLPDNSLAVHLYSGDAGPVENLKGRARASIIARITRLDGNRVTLDRALRTDLRPEWKPRLRAFEPTVTESGVENIGFEFTATPYQGHFTELGFNPVTLSGVAHCWVRNIRVRNADSGPYVSGAFNTVDGVAIESERLVAK